MHARIGRCRSTPATPRRSTRPRDQPLRLIGPARRRRHLRQLQVLGGQRRPLVLCWICSRAGHAPPLSRRSCRTLYGKFRHCRRPPRCRGARPLLDPTHCISPRRPLPRPLPLHTASLGSREGVRDALAAALPSGLPRTLLRTDYLRPNRGLAGGRGRWGVACGGGRGCRRERPR